MRIAITRRGSLFLLDGVNKFVYTLADGLNELGHEVFIVADAVQSSYSAGDGCLRNLFNIEGTHRICAFTDHKGQSLPKAALIWATEGSNFLNSLELDAVIENGIVPLRVNCNRIAVSHVIPGQHIKYNGLANLKMNANFFAAKYLYNKYADHRVCVSKKLQREFAELTGLNSSVIPLPIKLDLFKNSLFEDREPLILHVGTSPGKNVDISIRTIKVLTEDFGVKAKLVVVGHKNSWVEHLSTKYSYLMPSKLEFIYRADTIMMRDLLARASVLLLPSVYESFSYVVLESFASGLPVVVSSAIPSELVTDNFTGFVVPTFNPTDYAQKIRRLLTDSELWNMLSANAITKANDFSYLSIAKEYENLIHKMKSS